MGAADGMHAAVGEALEAARDQLVEAFDAAAGEQLDMFDLPTRFEGEQAEVQRGKVESARRGRGRPPGARNRVTQDLRRYLAAIGLDPAHWMIAWSQHTHETLARELECSLAEAWDRLFALHRELMSYCYGKALPVDDAGRPAPFLVMQIGGGGQIGGGPQSGRPWIYPGGPVVEAEQNQSVSGAAPAVSHELVSHEGNK